MSATHHTIPDSAPVDIPAICVGLHAGRPHDLANLSVGQLAELTFADWRMTEGWSSRHYAAVPYADALCYLETLADNFGADSGKSVALYFLTNVANWRGAVARAVKAELRKRVAACR